ncbi:MAG: hypothetical protein RIN56_20430 [Sporomusaceae bacterium]|nr:hypothetical protein [Sporomusaceae bacterium]
MTKHVNVEKINIEKIIDQAVTKAIKASAILGMEKGKAEAKNVFRQTEIRLYAYPELRRNIDKYHRDIEDLRRESPGSGKSKDITFFSTIGGNTRLTAEEIQEGRILLVQRKLWRDEVEIKEIEYALQCVVDDEYYPLLTMRYFERKKDDEIAKKIICDPSTVRRNKNRLIRMIAVKLYGAEAVT